MRRIDPETGEVIETIHLASPMNKKRGASEAEIEAGKSPAGAWTRETLAGWGIAWPPKRGWKKRLIAEHRRWQRGGVERVLSPAGSNEPDGFSSAGHETQQYLVRMVQGDAGAMVIGSEVAHLWNGVDTACRMWSTSDMTVVRPRRAYVVYGHNPGLRICRMCSINAEKPKDIMTVTWGATWED